MKKKSADLSKKVLASALSAAMVVAFAPAVALGDGTDGVGAGGDSVPQSIDSAVAAVGESTYASLNEAFAAAIASTTDKTVKLLANVDNFEGVVIQPEQEVTLDLNGMTLTSAVNSTDSSKHYYAVENWGTFTLEDSSAAKTGKVVTRGLDNELGYDSEANEWIEGNMTINGGTVVACDANGGACVWNEAVLTINDGTFQTTAEGTTGSDTSLALRNNGIATITGGKFDCASKWSYAIVSKNILEITPASGSTVEVYGAKGCLGVDGGTAVIDGGKYSTSDYYALYVSNDGQGKEPTTAAVTVNGGEFDASTYSVWVGSDYNNPVNSTIQINDGTFKKPLCAQDCTLTGAIKIAGGSFLNGIARNAKSDDRIAITGGKFSEDPASYVPASGYDIHQVGSVYAVHAADAGTTWLGGSSATCTSSGSTAAGYCKGCYDLGVSNVVSSSSTIPALGHEYTWVTTTPATESAEGVMTGTCARCGSTITSPIPKLPASGSNETATDSSGAKIDVTIDTNESVTLPDGTQAAGTATYEASESDAAKAEIAVPSTVTVGSNTYVVTKIADSAFEGQEQLASVTIPDTVVEIGASAFAGTSVASVTIPESTTVIGEGAFKGCSSLESVDIKGDVTKIAADTFAGTALTSVDIPDSVATIGARAFADSLIKTVSSQATTVSKSAFAGCSALKSVDLPKAKTIGKNAFKGAGLLKSVDLPKVETIGKGVFKGAGLLKSVTTGTKLASIGKKAFAGTAVKKLVLTSKKLTASSVAGSLKGSSVVKVVVKVSGSKKAQEKIVDKYTKAFAKKNSGKKVKVVAAK